MTDQKAQLRGEVDKSLADMVDKELAKAGLTEIVDFTREIFYCKFTSANPEIITAGNPNELADKIRLVINCDLIKSPESIPDPDSLKLVRIVPQSQNKAGEKEKSVEISPEGSLLRGSLENLAKQRQAEAEERRQAAKEAAAEFSGPKPE